MGGNEYGKSSHLSIFTSLKHLMVLLKCNFSGLNFYTLPKTLMALRAMQLNFFKVETCLNNAFNNWDPQVLQFTKHCSWRFLPYNHSIGISPCSLWEVKWVVLCVYTIEYFSPIHGTDGLRLGNGDRASCPRAPLPRRGLNRGPLVWKSKVNHSATTAKSYIYAKGQCFTTFKVRNHSLQKVVPVLACFNSCCGDDRSCLIFHHTKITF